MHCYYVHVAVHLHVHCEIHGTYFRGLGPRMAINENVLIL